MQSRDELFEEYCQLKNVYFERQHFWGNLLLWNVFKKQSKAAFKRCMQKPIKWSEKK